MRIPGPALVLPLFLAGCAIPSAAEVTSLVRDGVSYVSAGKSSTDQTKPAVAHKDCAPSRGVDDTPVCDPADETLNLDPEMGSVDPGAASHSGSTGKLEAANEPLPKPVPSPPARKKFRIMTNAMPTLTPGPVGHGSNTVSLAMAITPAERPRPPDEYADAGPAPQPSAPQVAVASLAPVSRLTLPERHATTYAVIGSFRNIDNARRMVDARTDRAVMQTVEVDGKTSYRVLVDQPLKQARRDGFADAWPVRLCSGDLQVPPCSGRVVKRNVGGVELSENRVRR